MGNKSSKMINENDAAKDSNEEMSTKSNEEVSNINPKNKTFDAKMIKIDPKNINFDPKMIKVNQKNSINCLPLWSLGVRVDKKVAMGRLIFFYVFKKCY